MNVTLSLFAGVGAQFFDNNGVPLSGGKIYTYAAGTTTPLSTYTTASDSAFRTNPIILDSSGRVSDGGEIWINIGQGYKFVLKTSADVLIATYDNVPSGAQPPAANDANSIMYEQGYTVTAGSFVVGFTYRILSVGTTNFTLIGASSNTSGVYFTATGVGSGTGTARLSQTVEQKLQQTISVLDFGADPTGAISSVSAFQNAINSFSNLTNVYVINIPTGVYLGNMTTLTYGNRFIVWQEEGGITYSTAAPLNVLCSRINVPRPADASRPYIVGKYGFHSGTGVTTVNDFATVRVDRIADYTGTASGVTNAFRVASYVSSTVGTSAVNKPEWCITGFIQNDSLYSKTVATTGVAYRSVDGATWAGQFNANDLSNGATSTRNIRGIEANVQSDDDDVNYKRIGINIVAHSISGTVYNPASYTGYGLLVNSHTGNYRKAIAVESIGTSTIDIGLDLSDVNFQTNNAIKLRANNFIDFNGAALTKIGMRYNSTNGWVQITNGTTPYIEFLIGAALPRIRLNGIAEIVSAAGSPEGVITSPVGSLYMRTDGGAGTTLYVKESGTGNTGWVAK